MLSRLQPRHRAADNRHCIRYYLDKHSHRPIQKDDVALSLTEPIESERPVDLAAWAKEVGGVAVGLHLQEGGVAVEDVVDMVVERARQLGAKG